MLNTKNPLQPVVWMLALCVIAFSPVQAALPSAIGDGQALPSLAPMLEKTSPAVVNIAIETRIRTARNPLMEDPFFRRFFNIPEQQQRERRAASAGSGVIVDAKAGYVLTNAHVVKNAH